MASEDPQTTAPPPEYKPKKILYCGICTLPPEYCEFGGTTTQCEEWLQKNNPDLHQKLYSEEAITTSLSTLSVAARERAQKDSARKSAKAALSADRAATARATSIVTIKRVERQKRKYVTVITGLEAHGHDLKKVAKELGKKFASGASVTKTVGDGGKGEEITVQGDLQADIEEWVLREMPEIPEDNVECTEDKKKKAAGP